MPNICDIHADTIGKYIKENHPKELARIQELNKLSAFRNTWHERIVREEVKQAAKDGKTKLQFPTGETAMKIEGLGNTAGDRWILTGAGREGMGRTLEIADLKEGITIHQDGVNKWIITDVLGDGKFKAVPKNRYEYNPDKFYGTAKEHADMVDAYKETFDISGKVDTSNPIYKFYEKEMGKYLQNKFGATRITDPQGVSWYEVAIEKARAKMPIDAFGGISAKTALKTAGIATLGALGWNPYINYLDKKHQREIYDSVKESIDQGEFAAASEGINQVKDTEKQAELRDYLAKALEQPSEGRLVPGEEPKIPDNFHYTPDGIAPN